MMRRCGLLLNRDKKIIGTIPGICIGDVFFNIMELAVVGLHGQPKSGIDYLPNDMSLNGEPIATSVIVSGEYDNSVDLGDVIIYSCHGGHNNKNSSQVLNQKLEDENLAMERSMHYGIEVRVIRGVQLEGTSSTSSKFYFYNGLYRIVDCRFDVGVYTFKLKRVEGQMKTDSLVMKEALRTRNHPLWYKPMFVLALDISNKKENVGVRLFNDVDGNNDPISFEYLLRAVFPPLIVHQSKRVVGCKCIGKCVEGCFCFMKNGNECPYTQSGILLKGRPTAH
ncbi:hypothetical protein TSUD_16520 [Trifolium subterraneum]|uniref:YDG domain-containing protein n=1 Tax=Trifolium subterraneum TaxID=3900 RepID=A0A2Z6MNC4_TRISU|nr:hypothetical protein TSUD_16520 [Trifolium subterraneum]